MHTSSGWLGGVLIAFAISFAATAAETVTRILALGDSITCGSNAIDLPNDDIPGGYRRELANRLAAAGRVIDFTGSLTYNAFPGMDAEHAGHPGFRTDEILTVLPAELAGYPEVVLLHLGTIDILQGRSVSAALANLESVIDQILADSHRQLHVATLIPIAQDWQGRTAAQLNAEVNSFNTGLRELVRQEAATGKRIFLVEMNGSVVLDNPMPAKRFFQPGDGIHPGQAGYDQMAGIWFAELDPIAFSVPLNGGFDWGGAAWTTEGAVTFLQDPDGCFAAFPQNGVLSQSFSSLPGVRYELTLKACNPSAVEPAAFEVKLSGTGDLLSQTVNLPADAAWQSHRYEFTADETNLTLRISDHSGAAGGQWLLDDVKIAPVPMPVTVLPRRPLRAHPENPQLFDFRGRPTTLRTFGEHYSSVINADFDYIPYLDTLKRDGLNLTRVFLLGFRHPKRGTPVSPLSPEPADFVQPWRRATTGETSLDGLGKWDFSTWNEAYFSRLNAFVQACSDRGIAVELTLFSTWYDDEDWQASPFHPSNNVQGYGHPNRNQALRPVDGNLLRVQQDAVRRIVTELNRFDNVYYETQNEPFWNEPGLGDELEAEFQLQILGVIRRTEAALPNRHLIAHNFPQQIARLTNGFDIVNEHYPVAVNLLPPNPVIPGAEALLDNPHGLGRLLSFDETHTDTPLQARLEAWMFLNGGGAVYNGLDVPYFIYSAQNEAGDTVQGREFRKAVADAGRYTDSLHQTALRRDGSWLTGSLPQGVTVQAMASPGQQYTAYFHHGGRNAHPGQLSYDPIDGGNHTLDAVVTLESGTWRAAWVRPSDLTEIRIVEFTHAGGTRTLTSPIYQNDVALRIDRTGAEDRTPPPPPRETSAVSSPAASVILTWIPAEAADVAIYQIYRPTAAGAAVSPESLLATVSADQLTYTDTTTQPGMTYHYLVTAVDSAGNQSLPGPETTIVPTLDNLPFGGSAHPVPGIIQVEDFDHGGEGVAWHDLTPASSGAPYRPGDGVDLAACADAGGGWQVTGIESGEWLEYSALVAAPGRHGLEVRAAASAPGGRLGLEINGVDAGFQIQVPQGAGFWQTLVSPPFTLPSGNCILRLRVDGVPVAGGTFSINWISLTAQLVNGPTANAGPDQQIPDADGNGSENVTLNASASLPGDTPIASHTWLKFGQTIASGVQPVVNLPGGNHNLTLLVSDGAGLTSTDTVRVSVIPRGFVNGGFEAGFAGWTTTGNIDLQSYLPYAPTEGAQLVCFNDFNRTPNGVLSQSFSTVPGAAYSLAFDMGVLSYNTNLQTLQASVTGTGSLLSRTLSLNGAGAGKNRWQGQSFTFTADSTTTTLTFRDLSPVTVNLDLLLDNVRVTGPPPVMPNLAPVAADDAYATTQEIPLIAAAPGLLANDTDSDEDPLTGVLKTPPVHGNVTLRTDGGFTYQPNPGYFGADLFTYQAHDGGVGSAPATVRITVIERPPGPQVVADFYQTLENAPLLVPANGVLANDTDPDDAALTAVLDAGPVHGGLELSADGGFVYQPQAGFFGVDSFRYHATNGSRDSDEGTVTITVSEVVPPPLARDDFHDTDEDVPLAVPAPGVLANDADPRARPLAAMLVTPPANGTLELRADGSFLYMPVEGYFGTDSFVYQAGNGVNVSSDATVTLTIRDVIPPAVGTADSYAVNEGGVLIVQAPGLLDNDTDPEDRSLTAVSDTMPANGALVLSEDGGFTYTPASGFYGTDSFNYRISNGATISGPVVVTLAVVEVVPAPVAVDDLFFASRDKAVMVPAKGVLANDHDPRSRHLQAALLDLPAHGSLTLHPNGGFHYTPEEGYFGTDGFRYSARNGVRESEPASVMIEVLETVAQPVANDDSHATDEGVTLVIQGNGVLTNDSTLGPFPLTAELVSATLHGQLVLESNGAFTYAPESGFFGQDSFGYRALNGPVASEPATVRIDVREVVPAPVAAADAFVTREDVLLTVPAAGVLENDSDPRGRPLSARLVSGPSHGTLDLRPDGAFTYTPASGFFGGDAFVYQSHNGIVGSPPAAVSLTVTEVGPAPLATADQYDADEGNALTIAAPGVLSNDSDSRGRALTAVVDAAPSQGSLSLAANGGFTYTPASGYSGPDSFRYKSFNGVLGSEPATVTLNVRPAFSGLVNGSFESGLSGWTSTGNLRVESLAPYVPTHGSRLMAFNGSNLPANAVLSQAFSTVLGQTYKLEFDAGVLAYNTVSQTLQVELSGTGILLSRSITIQGAGGGANRWNAQSFTFTANRSTTTLTFRDVSPATLNLDLLLDQVRVTPETPAANTAPVAEADAYVTSRDTTLNVPAPGLLGNDSDSQTSALTATLVSSPAHGTITLAADGSFIYQPSAGFTGEDSFTYRASDGSLVSAPATVGISVNAVAVGGLVNGSFESGLNGWTTSGILGVQSGSPYSATDGTKLVAFNSGNRTPDAVLSQAFASTPGQAYRLEFDLGVLAYNTASQTVSVAVTGSAALFSQSITVTGSGNGGMRWLPQSFTFTANSATTTLVFRDVSSTTTNLDMTLDHVRVTPVAAPSNTAPVAVADSYVVIKDTPLTIVSPGVLGNDTDAQSNPLTAILVVGSTNGSLSLRPDGGFTYTPAAGFTGSDSFSYRCNDGSLNSEIVSVSLTMNASSPAFSGVVNGSFESGFSGWTYTGNQSIQSTAPYAATQGSRLVGFNGGNQAPNAVLSQSFATVSGQSYVLAFDAGSLAYNSSAQTMLVSVTGGATLLSKTITIPGLGNGTNRWLPQSFTFVADSATSLLTFRDQSAATIAVDMTLDNVRVTAAMAAAMSAMSAPVDKVPAPPSRDLVSPAPNLPSPVLSFEADRAVIRLAAAPSGNYVLERSKNLKQWELRQKKEHPEAGLLEFRDPLEAEPDGRLPDRMFYRIGRVTP